MYYRFRDLLEPDVGLHVLGPPLGHGSPFAPPRGDRLLPHFVRTDAEDAPILGEQPGHQLSLAMVNHPGVFVDQRLNCQPVSRRDRIGH